jgi:hypothetical protein
MAACALACAAIVTLLPTLAAQSAAPPQTETRVSPLESLGVDAATGLPLFAPRGDAVTALAVLAARGDRPRLQLTDVALGDSGSVALDLSALDLGRLRFGFEVDGRPGGDLLDGLDLSVWTGTVAGAAGSEALVAFSNHGTWGWVRTDATSDAVHLLSRPTDGDWTRARVVVANEAELAVRGLRPGPLCAGEQLVPASAGLGAHGAAAGTKSDVGPGDGAGDCSHWECGMAIVTDFQLYSLFNDLGAETGYIATLLAAISARYEEQIDTILVFPYVAFYTTASDPWVAPDGPGSSIDMLIEFQNAWAGAIPAGANLGHFLSGADLGGGVAFLDVLSDTSHSFTFGVSGNVDGQTPFPIAVGPLNWDFMVCAHETGHNFGSPHTHDFVPPIDECAFGNCITDGTIMSYCHICPGGMNNITTFFHPLCVELMKAGANAGLPIKAPLVVAAGSQPTLIEGYLSTPLTVEVQGLPVGPVLLNYRASPADAVLTKELVPLGAGLYGTNLPGPACGDEPEWWFSTTDETCGPFATESFSASVGHKVTLLTDHVEIDSGWTAGVAGDDAASGLWMRGDPLGTGAQPEDDQSEPGTDCFFTGQGSDGGSIGENDVDSGHTTLVTPPIDLSGGDARIGYWRWYSNDAGGAPNEDVLEVEISNDGSNWVDVETVGPGGAGTGGGWIYHDLQVSDFVAPNATVQLRFIASDLNSGSIVEAAIDELEVFRIECGSICQADAGFGGPGTATLSVCGGDLSTGTTATIAISGATPGGMVLLFAGPDSNPTPALGGTIVPMPPTLRYFEPLDENGSYSYTFPGGGGPLSFYVQGMYLQPTLPAPGWGITNSVRVDLQP